MPQVSNFYPISHSAQTVQPFRVMKILGQAKQLEAQGKDVIHMEIGEPDFPSLACVHEGALKAAQKGLTHYTPTLGLPELREKLADFYLGFYRARIPAERIIMTPGSSSALQLVLTALLNPGDRVLMSDPTYPCNRQFVDLLHGEVISVPVDQQTHYQLNLALIEKHWQPGIKAVMIASPANPTGTLIEQAELTQIARFLSKKRAWLIVDEIYQGLVYERPPESVLANSDLPDNVIVINSFSKYFGMTGWRLGWCVAPASLIPVLERLGQNLFLAAPTPAQYGALNILEPKALEALEKRRQCFQERRDGLLQTMQEAGFRLNSRPQGAFYLYWDVSEWTGEAEKWASELLNQTGVALTPGTDFGTHRAAQHVRLAYTADQARLTEAVSRISHFLQTQP